LIKTLGCPDPDRRRESTDLGKGIAVKDRRRVTGALNVMSAVKPDSFACADGEAPNSLMFGHRGGGNVERRIPLVASTTSWMPDLLWEIFHVWDDGSVSRR